MDMSHAQGYLLPALIGERASSATARRLPRTCALAALLAVATGVWTDLPAAQAYDYDYYTWCVEAVGGADYCCSQAGGVFTGEGCRDTVPSKAPPYVPPNNGFFVP
jgi:hypothetical protein